MNSLRTVLRMAATRVAPVRAAFRPASTEAAQVSAEKMTIPPQDGIDRPASAKLGKICDEIATLNLLEVSELSSLLKKKLNLPETSFMPAAFAGAPAPQAAADDDEDAAGPKKVQTSFKVKLVQFDEKQKIALIREIKSLMEGLNLVQAKKFVEGVPAVVKDEVSKDEAEKLKEAISKVGGIVEIE